MQAGDRDISADAARESVMHAFTDWYALQPKAATEEARIHEAAERFPCCYRASCA